MADPVGAIRVALSVDSAAFEKGLNRARGRLSNFGQQIRTGIATMAKWAAGVAAAGVAIGTVFVRNAMKAIDALAKTADRLGMTTEGLARMRYAAEQTGVAANTLDMAMQRMTRRIAEAAVGTGEAQGALKELGLDAQALAQMRPEEAFQQIAGAMQNVQSQGERVRLAFKLFDSEGVALVNTLRLGEEGLEAMAREADALGLSLSRVDAAKVEQANDAMTRIRSLIQGIGRRIAVHLAPYIAGVADLIAHWGLETQGFRDIIDNTMSFALRMTGRFSDAIEVVIRGINIGKVAQAQFGYAVTEAFRLAVRGVTALSDGVTGLTNLAIRGINALRSELGREALPELKGLGESGFVQSIEDAASQARAYLRQVGEEAGNVFEPLPSSKIEEWIEQVRSTADATAEEFAARLADRADLMDQFRDADGEGGGGLGTSPADLERERELLEQRLQMLQEHLMSEKELEILRFEERMELLREALEAELLTKQEYQELEAELLQQHEDALTKIEEDAARRRTAIAEKEQRDLARIQEMEQRKRLSGYQNFAQNTMALGQQVFEDNKVLALAQALLSARTAIVEAYEWGSSIGGPPMGAAAAAVAAAATAAQVAAVRSTSVGSRGGAAGAGSGGSMGAVEDPAAGDGQGGQQQPIQRTVHLNIVGDVFDQKTVRNLAEQINEYAEDGFRLTVRA